MSAMRVIGKSLPKVFVALRKHARPSRIEMHPFHVMEK